LRRPLAEARGDIPGAGDTAGNWQGRYSDAIPLADERFARHLTDLDSELVADICHRGDAHRRR